MGLEGQGKADVKNWAEIVENGIEPGRVSAGKFNCWNEIAEFGDERLGCECEMNVVENRVLSRATQGLTCRYMWFVPRGTYGSIGIGASGPASLTDLAVIRDCLATLELFHVEQRWPRQIARM